MEYKKVAEILLCPICQDISVPPIYQCANGHVICNGCLNLLKDAHCPTCRSELPQDKIRALALEQLANTIDVKCKHWIRGCTTTHGLKVINAHLQKCIYEGVDFCKQFGSKCTSHVALMDFKEHCLTYHGSTTRTMVNSSDADIRCDIDQSIILGDLISSQEDHVSSFIAWEPCFLITERNIYAITSKYDLAQKLFQWRTVLIPHSDFYSTTNDSTSERVELTTKIAEDGDLEEDLQNKTIWFGKCLNFSQKEENPPKNATCSIPLCFFTGSAKPTDIDMDNLIKWRLSIVISSTGNTNAKKPAVSQVQPKPNILPKPLAQVTPATTKAGKMSLAIAKMIQEYGTNANASSVSSGMGVSSTNLAGKPQKDAKEPPSVRKPDLIESHAYRKLKGDGISSQEIFPQKCDACEKSPITGTLFTCTECSSVYLCEACARTGIHDHHPLIRIKYKELRAFKDSPEPVEEISGGECVVHNVQCDSCGVLPIFGVRYKCCCCLDVDICAKCHDKGFHDFHWCIRTTKYDPVGMLTTISKLPDNALRSFHEVATARGYRLTD